MPKGTTYVGRPTRWSNPWTPGHHGTAGEVADRYRKWLAGELDLEAISRPYGWRAQAVLKWLTDEREAVLKRIPALRGRDLACTCPLDEPCHADVLLELANG
jgi:hypothetical protein